MLETLIPPADRCNAIDDVKYVLLYDAGKQKYPDIPYLILPTMILIRTI